MTGGHEQPITERSSSFNRPKWEGIRGITGDDSREQELGVGKWSESARSLEEVRREMDSAPVRELELDSSRGQWGMLLLFLALIGALVAWWWIFQSGEDDSSPSSEESTLSGPSGTRLPGETNADPTLPTVIISTAPNEGAEVKIKGKTVPGTTPVEVSLETDISQVDICVKIDEWVCDIVPLETLLKNDKYVMPTRPSSD